MFLTQGNSQLESAFDSPPGLRNCQGTCQGTRSKTGAIWIEPTNFYSSGKTPEIHARNLNLNYCGALSLANCSFVNAPII